MPNMKAVEQSVLDHHRSLQALPISSASGSSYHNFDLGGADPRPAADIDCPGGISLSMLQGLATDCPRDCLYNETMPDFMLKEYDCKDESGNTGPCERCKVGPYEEFGVACSATTACTTRIDGFLQNDAQLKCLLKFTFHDVMSLWELKIHFEYMSSACNPVFPDNEFISASLTYDPAAPTAPAMAMPLSFQQTGTAARVLKVRPGCSIDNVMDNEADARAFFEGALPWSVTATDLTSSMIAVTEAAGVMLKEANAMMISRMGEQVSEGIMPEAEGALMMDKMSTVFESKMGSCSEGHECSDEELAATSVPPEAAINAFVNGVGGPGGVVTNMIEASLATETFGSSECLVSCAPYDIDGAKGTCEPLDYEAMGEDLKAYQAKQKMLSSFLYTVGADMVLEHICGMDGIHRQLKGRSLRRQSGRELGGAEACDAISKLCVYQEGCGTNVTLADGSEVTAYCAEGECSKDGYDEVMRCMPIPPKFECDDVMNEFKEAANNCSTLVVIDGLEEGFNCLHKYVDDLYGDCVHVPSPDMEECSHILVIGMEIIHAFEHAVEVLKTHPEELVEKLMESMTNNADLFIKMQERILEMSMPIWFESEEDPADILDDTKDLSTVIDMCDPVMSFGRATDIQWDQDCTLFESIMCLSVDPYNNITMLSSEEGKFAMYFCARAYMSFYPADDGIFQTCLAESAANAGGPFACIENELDPIVAAYVGAGSDSIEGEKITSATGADMTHAMDDAMYTATMDPAEVVAANAEMVTYEGMRKLYEKRRRLQGKEDCLNINGKQYCSKDASPQSVDPPAPPLSNGKAVNAHKFFKRKHKARKLHRAHKHLMRKHRRLSRR
jgi:hypothetical protein